MERWEEKKSVCIEYVEANRLFMETEQKVREAFLAISEHNYIDLMPDQYRAAYDSLVERVVGEEAYRWLEYWMWETDFGTSATFKVIVHGNEYNKEYFASDLSKYLDVVMCLKEV